MKRLISVVNSLLLILALLLTSLLISSYDLNFYRNYQADRDIHLEAGISREELEEVNQDLVAYIKTGENSLLEKWFNQREVSHMEDVFQLYRLARYVRFFSLVLAIGILAYMNFRHRNYLKILTSSLLVTSLVLALGLFLGMRFFSQVFIEFHYLFFDNDLWLLDPRTDMMIRMLPESFFQLMTVKIGLMTFFSIGVLVLIFNRINRRRIYGSTSR